VVRSILCYLSVIYCCVSLCCANHIATMLVGCFLDRNSMLQILCDIQSAVIVAYLCDVVLASVPGVGRVQLANCIP